MMFESVRKKIAFWVYPEITSIINDNRVINDQLREQLRIERMRSEGIDTKNFMRHILGLVTIDVEMIDDIEHGLTEDERKSFHRFGFELAQGRWFKHIRAYLLNKQASKTLRDMLISERQSWIGGGTLNGIMLFDEVVEHLRGLHESDIMPEETFNKNDIIPT